MPPIEPLGGPERVAAPPSSPPPAAPAALTPGLDRPDAERDPSADSYAVSLTQAGLVGRAMIDASATPRSVRVGGADPSPVEGARKVERVLAPYGVAMLPADAAVEARRRAVEAAETAARAVTAAGRAEDEATTAETLAAADRDERQAAASEEAGRVALADEAPRALATPAPKPEPPARSPEAAPSRDEATV